MFLQGNLQLVFDALYGMGVIEPVLEMDWSEPISNMHQNFEKLVEILDVVNDHQAGVEGLMFELQKFSHESLEYLAMEVARELADFHSRETLH